MYVLNTLLQGIYITENLVMHIHYRGSHSSRLLNVVLRIRNHEMNIKLLGQHLRNSLHDGKLYEILGTKCPSMTSK